MWRVRRTSSARRNKGRVGNDDEYSEIVLSLGKELHGLSIKQQTQINEQIHGVYPEATKSMNNDDIAVIKPPISPGPAVTAIASTLLILSNFASFKDLFIKLFNLIICDLAAISGTTPPNSACSSICEYIL